MSTLLHGLSSVSVSMDCRNRRGYRLTHGIVPRRLDKVIYDVHGKVEGKA